MQSFWVVAHARRPEGTRHTRLVCGNLRTTTMARIRRECRELSVPIIKFRRPIDILLDDVGWSRRPFVYHGRDILKENIREARTLQPRSTQERTVPPFSIQSKQSNTVTMPPPGLKKRSQSMDPKQHDDCNQFRILFTRGDLPVILDHTGGSGEPPKALRWAKHPSQMQSDTIAYLLPKFAMGLPIIDQPCRKVAEWALNDLLDASRDVRSVLPAVPQLVRSMRAALYSFDSDKRKTALLLLAKMTRLPGLGPALVPFYRQLLPPLRKVGAVGVGQGNGRSQQLDDLVQQTLNGLERTGGPGAYINIKYIIPTYDSCLMSF